MTTMVYTYEPLLRPADMTTVPRGWIYVEAPPDLSGLRSDIPSSRCRHGVIAYFAALSIEVQRAHDLRYLGSLDLPGDFPMLSMLERHDGA